MSKNKKHFSNKITEVPINEVEKEEIVDGIDAEELDIRIGYVNVPALNVRAKANKDAEILATIEKDDAVEILGEDGGWFKIPFSDKVGYCMKQFITE